MTIGTEIIRNAAGTLDVLTSNLAADNPLRLETSEGAKAAVANLYRIADQVDAQAAENAEARGQIEHLDRQNDRLREVLDSIRQYGADTLSGRVDGPNDRAWQREAVREMTKRARAALQGAPNDK
ncbi:hypothetical protein ABRY94_11960 [Castellaniella ginsengisoli]|uniref:Uncharacterized protein n=1 Tax=Castellaniella ginsengisoli TaxID=546114 RepID=A0AB39ER73_9BURK